MSAKNKPSPVFIPPSLDNYAAFRRQLIRRDLEALRALNTHIVHFSLVDLDEISFAYTHPTGD
jgi:hypothetical protein